MRRGSGSWISCHAASIDFFELAVDVAIAVFGVSSPVVLVCTVGVLTEVPVMLLLVKFINRTDGWFPDGPE
jgi:ACR3 family arsenite transporter